MVIIGSTPQPGVRVIPEYLAYELMNGEALPYPGYREVLAGAMNPEGVRGSSSLKAFLTSVLSFCISNILDRTKYLLAIGEPGLQIDEENILTLDLGVFEKDKVTIDDQYFAIPPRSVILIDTKVDLSETSWNSDMDYILEKIQKLLTFGTESVLWIRTQRNKVLISTSYKNWYYANFDEDILLLGDCVLNVAQLLMDEEIEY